MTLTIADAHGPIRLHSSQPLALPVFSGAGGVGRSTVAALIAALLERYTVPADREGGGVVLCDTSVRGLSPWPCWVDVAAPLGTTQVLHAPFPRPVRAHETHAASIFQAMPGRSVLVMTDTGLGAARGSTVIGTPEAWFQVARGTRAIVLDGDAYEGVRLNRHAARPDRPSLSSRWLSVPRLRAALVWVTDPTPAGYRRTHAAVEAAMVAGLDLRRVTVAVNHGRISAASAAPPSARSGFARRVGAVVDLHLAAALGATGGVPRFGEARLARPDAQKLLAAVLRTARAST